MMYGRVLLVACRHCNYRVWETDMARHLRDCHPGKLAPQDADDGDLVFRAWKYDFNGRKIWARDYGLRAWPLYRTAPQAR
jgi:hypothetical protein